MAFVAQKVRAARLHLQKSDPVMKSIIKRVGPFTLKANRDRFQMLARSILSQQISTSAARTIRERLERATEPEGITPEAILRFDLEELRELGISRQKGTYLRDLAEKVQTNQVCLRTIARMPDDEVIANLTQIKGIGVWTAQMFLMFSLARMDVLPVDDLGLQNAIKKHYPVRGKLHRDKIHRIARPWRPYATVASWYLWRSLDLDD